MPGGNWWWVVGAASGARTEKLTIVVGSADTGAGCEVQDKSSGNTLGYVEDSTTGVFDIPSGHTIRIVPFVVGGGWTNPQPQEFVMDAPRTVYLTYTPPLVSVTVLLDGPSGITATVLNATTGQTLGTATGPGTTPYSIPRGHRLRVVPADLSGYDTPAAQELTATGGEELDLSWAQNTFNLVVQVSGPDQASVTALDVTSGQTLGAWTGVGEYTVPVRKGHTIRVTAAAVQDYNTPAVQEFVVGSADKVVKVAYTATQASGQAQLVTSGLYGSWRMAEGSGTTTASEAGLGSTLTLTSDSGAIPAWRGGGGLTFSGTSQLRRVNEAALDTSAGVTLTIGFVPGSFTGVKNLMQRSAGNNGYVMAANTSTGKVQVSMGLGGSRSSAGLTPYSQGTPLVLCIALPMSGTAAANVNGNEINFTPNSFAWVNAAANLLLGYTFVGDIHYAALHNRALTLQERANMVAYAQGVLRGRGVLP